MPYQPIYCRKAAKCISLSCAPTCGSNLTNNLLSKDSIKVEISCVISNKEFHNLYTYYHWTIDTEIIYE